jgi:hypothetical protein
MNVGDFFLDIFFGLLNEEIAYVYQYIIMYHLGDVVI